MSKKRVATRSSCKEQPENIDLFEEEEVLVAKRKKLSSSRKTTLQDLPTEMLQCILAKAVFMEAKSMKVKKRILWQEKADLVISRLRTVCSQWNSVLTTDYFQRELHRIRAQSTICLEIVEQFRIKFTVFFMTTLGDEIFLLCRSNGWWKGYGFVINVCERSNQARKAKDVIPLYGMQQVFGMEACKLFNCLYVLTWDSHSNSVLRIRREEDQSFSTTTLISDPKLSMPILSVSSSNGSLVIVSRWGTDRVRDVQVYDAKGSFQHRIRMCKDIFSERCFSKFMLRPDGNILLFSTSKPFGTELTEMDIRGRLVHRFRSRLRSGSEFRPCLELHASFADGHGRIYIAGSSSFVELVGEELNLLDFEGPELRVHNSIYRPVVHFDSEKNEVLRISYTKSGKTKLLSVFRFV